MSRARRLEAHAGPSQQSNWDWRAAGNFTAGGAGGSLLLFAALAAPATDAWRWLALVAIVLVGAGLFCVWLEIGRPLRALNVFRHAESSWMTREALVAVALFASAGAGFFLGSPPILIWFAGACGAAFLYCQARILHADRGIPAWRQPLCARLLIATGLTEGVALLVVLQPLLNVTARWPAVVLLLLLALRAGLWRAYREALESTGAPVKALAVLRSLDRPLLLGGHALPALLVLLGLALGWPVSTAGSPIASAGALAAVLGGWFFKYALLRRAGYTQGYALPHVPVRGRGTSAPGVRPGWSRP